jgi:hypothetical protein
MSKSAFLLVGGLILAVVAYQVLERVPTDAMNVALGVACGIGASIPVSLGLLIALTRRRQTNNAQVEWSDPEPEPVRYAPPVQRIPQQAQAPQMQAHSANAPQPQIIVIAPPQGQFAQGQFPQGFPFPAQWTNQQFVGMNEQADPIDSREWRIIGEE